MISGRVFFGLFATLIFLVAAGCTGLRDSGTPTFLLPKMDAAGNTSLQETAIPTLSSPYRVEGPAARVYLDPNANNSAMTGEIAEPHLAKSGNLFIPLDAESGVTLSVYSFFEHIMFYEQRVLIDSKISWPRTIGIYKNVASMPPGLENNALYVGAPGDFYALLPYDGQSQEALAFNDGVLGHEHFHAHFDRLVISRVPELSHPNPMDTALAYRCPKTTLQYEILVVRGWNEGLADFYGAVTSGQPKFMFASLPAIISRDVSLAPMPLVTFATVHQKMLSNAAGNGCVSFDPYQIGLQVARVLYTVAGNGEFPAVNENGQSFTKWERAARYVLHRLQGFSVAFGGRDWSMTETDFVLQYLLQGVKLSSSSCRAVQLASPNMNGYPQCASY